MPLHVLWYDAALRLALAVLAGGLIGLDRDERGHPAGLRTNMLVCLAACIAMLQANLLNVSQGKSPDSFAVMDTMRMPLGILTGIGFIGAGAIIKRGRLVVGMTTAATIWFVTVMGLCFGGGQIKLGLAAFVLAYLILTVLKGAERWLPQYHQAAVFITTPFEHIHQAQIFDSMIALGVQARPVSVAHDREHRVSRMELNLRWKEVGKEGRLPAIVQALERQPEVLRLQAKVLS